MRLAPAELARPCHLVALRSTLVCLHLRHQMSPDVALVFHKSQLSAPGSSFSPTTWSPASTFRQLPQRRNCLFGFDRRLRPRPNRPVLQLPPLVPQLPPLLLHLPPQLPRLRSAAACCSLFGSGLNVIVMLLAFLLRPLGQPCRFPRQDRLREALEDGRDRALAVERPHDRGTISGPCTLSPCSKEFLCPIRFDLEVVTRRS